MKKKINKKELSPEQIEKQEAKKKKQTEKINRHIKQSSLMSFLHHNDTENKK